MADNNGDDYGDIPYEFDIDYVASNASGRAARRRIDLQSGRGDSDEAITNNFMGINHRIATAAVPKNREHSGYVFFTRPDLNLNEANIAQSPRMTQMVEAGEMSAERAILGMLDPFCPYTSKVEGTGLGGDGLPTIPFDNKSAFIPILGNRVVSLSGFPDNTLDVYTSEEGIKREQWTQVDSHYAVNYAFTLSVTFKNLDGDVTTQLATTWLEAMSNYYDGTFWPRTRNVVQREINYQTRIYRLIMDPTLRYVTKIGAALAAFPVNDNLGAVFNYDDTVRQLEANDQINLQFQCIGAAYLDPQLIEDFNEVVRLFNPDMVAVYNPNDPDDYIPSGDMILLKQSELAYFNYYGYPQIDRSTKELKWYVYQSDYNTIMNEVNS